MPMCSDMGPGWVGDYPNCRYDPSAATDFTGTVDSLGLGDLFADTTLAGEEWKKYFDPYDPRREEFLTRQAGTDIEQIREKWQQQLGGIGEAFRFQTGQLSEDWRGRKEGIGAEARQGFGQVRQMGQQMGQRGRGLTFGGERTRQKESEVTEAYKRSFGLGQSAYDIAMAGTALGYKGGIEQGQLGVQQGIIDVGQGLESDIFSAQEAWEQRQKDFAFSLLGTDIWGNGGGGDDLSTSTTGTNPWNYAAGDTDRGNLTGGLGSGGDSLGLGYAGVPHGGDVTPPENPSHGQSWGIPGTGTIVYWNADTGEWQSTPP